MRCTLSTQKPQTRRRPPYAPRSRPPSRRARAAGRWVAYPGAGAGAAPSAVVRDGGAPPGAVVGAAGLAFLRTPRLSRRNREAGDRITTGQIAHLRITAEVADDRNPVKRTSHARPSRGYVLLGSRRITR